MHIPKLTLREDRCMSSLSLQFCRLFVCTICFIPVPLLPTTTGVAGYLLNGYRPCMTYSFPESVFYVLGLLYMQLSGDDSGSLAHKHRPWHSLAIHRSNFFFFNVVWKKTFLRKTDNISA